MTQPRRCIATVGVFDGVHRGHSQLLSMMRTREPEASLLVVTFNDHPMRVIAPQAAPALLTLPEAKRRLLAEQGADRVELLDFGSVRSLTAGQFMHRLRLQGVTDLIIGFNNTFGSDRLRDIEQYRATGRRLGLRVDRAEPLLDGGAPVSSTRIRALIADGDIAGARLLLGHSYDISGTVAAGRRIGRTIGYPTANIQTHPRQLLPPPGVYAATTVVDGQMMPAMVNIGTRPTVDDDPTHTVEAHIIGCDADLYGRTLTISPVCRTRPIQRFSSLDELRRQLDADRQQSIAITRTLLR